MEEVNGKRAEMPPVVVDMLRPQMTLAESQEEGQEMQEADSAIPEDVDLSDDLPEEPAHPVLVVVPSPPVPHAKVSSMSAEDDPEFKRVLDAQEQAMMARGGKPDSALKYRSMSRKFLVYMKEKGWTFNTIPHNGVTQFNTERVVNPVTQNFHMQAIKGMLASARSLGIPVAEVELLAVKAPNNTRKKKERSMNNGAGAMVVPTPTIPMQVPMDLAAFAAQVAAQQPPQQTVDLPMGQTLQFPASPPRKAAPAAVAAPQNPLPNGGRVRISKRATGMEGMGVPPGTTIRIGEYYIPDIAVDGNVQNFIERQIHRSVSAAMRPGEVVTYLVEQIDARMHVSRTDEVHLMVSEGGGGGGAQTPQQPFLQQVQQPAAAQPPSDRITDMLMTMMNKAQADLEQMRAKQSQQFDPMVFLAQQNKEKELDRLETLLKEERRERDREPVRASGGGLGGIDNLFSMPPPPPPRPDPMQEAMAKIMEKMITQPPPPQRDPMELAIKLMEVMRPVAPPPQPRDDLMVQILRDQATRAEQARAETDRRNQELLLKLSQPEQQNSLSKSMNELQTMMQFAEKVYASRQNPGPSSPTLGDVAMQLMENLPALVPALTEMVKSRAANINASPALPPHMQPRPAQPVQQVQQVQTQPAAPVQAPVLPDEAKQAILDMVNIPDGAENDDARIEAIVSLMVSLYMAGGVWKEMLDHLQVVLQGADSRPELRSIIGALMKRCGAQPLMTVGVLDKITDTVHRRYTPLYHELAKGKPDKQLSDWDIWDENGKRKVVAAPAPAPAPVISFVTPTPAGEATVDVSPEEAQDEEQEEGEVSNG